jgi:hypothetical protein
VWNLEKIINFYKGYTETHIQRPFYDNKNSIWKILGLKIRIVWTCSTVSSTRTTFYFFKHQNLDFWWYFKVSSLNRFWQFWSDFASLAVAESMPETRLKSLKPHNSLTMNPKVACSGSLERYNPPLHTYNVSRTPQSNCSHTSLPKLAKSHFGSLGCLGIKTHIEVGVKLWSLDIGMHCTNILQKSNFDLDM